MIQLYKCFKHQSFFSSSFPPLCFLPTKEEVRNGIHDFISHSSFQNMTRTMRKILFVFFFFIHDNGRLHVEEAWKRLFLLVWLGPSVEPCTTMPRPLLDKGTNCRFVSQAWFMVLWSKSHTTSIGPFLGFVFHYFDNWIA